LLVVELEEQQAVELERAQQAVGLEREQLAVELEPRLQEHKWGGKLRKGSAVVQLKLD